MQSDMSYRQALVWSLGIVAFCIGIVMLALAALAV